MSSHRILSSLRNKTIFSEQMSLEKGEIMQKNSKILKNLGQGVILDNSYEELIKNQSFLEIPSQIFNPHRILILIALKRFGALDFSSLRDGVLLKSDGNLANHLRVLENLKLIDFKKEFVDRRPKTFYKLTKLGEKEIANLEFHLMDFLR